MAQIENLKIAIGQMDVIVGSPTKNVAKMAEMIAQAKADGADIIAFPEMCVGGYFLADKWTDEEYVDYLCSFNDQIRALSDGIGIVFGNVCREYKTDSHRGRDGRRNRYNTALFAYNGEWVKRESETAVPGHYVKSLHPDYRMFDDDRYFTSSRADSRYYEGCDFLADYCSPFLFEKDGETYKIGLQICEDLWSSDYAFDVTQYYTDSACDIIVNISASPWTMGKDAGRVKRVREHVASKGQIVPLLYVNAVGMQNTGKNILAFDGGSLLFTADGNVTCACRDDFEEELKIAQVGAAIEVPQAELISKIADGLIKTLRRFDQQIFSFHPKWVIGLSGGIDSSITCALLGLALEDRSRIVGYNLATRYNSDATKMNAYNLATAMGIRLVNGSIEDLVNATGSVLKLYGYPEETVSGLAQENIQARLRGHILSTFAAVEGGVIMNNGNKIECALGYATLYGDAIGAIGPLGDLTKVKLFALAKELNKRYGCEVVPENLVPEETEDGFNWETMPSAELRDAQVDPMKWFYHDWLVEKLLDYPGYGIETIMEQYKEDKLASTPVGKWIKFWDLEDPQAFIDDIEWILRQIQNSVFKRIQTPPIITLTRGSFGFDFRENQAAYEKTAKYMKLKEEILSQK